MKTLYLNLKLLILSLAVACIGCSANNSTNSNNTNSTNNMEQTDSTKIDNGRTKVAFSTTMGDFTVELYNETPKHRDNFLKLVKDSFYNDVLFHRVIRNFMVQTGDPDSRNAAPNAMLGAGGPGYNIEAEIVYPQFFHKKGALAAARQADQVNPKRESSGSQFYVVTGRRYTQDQLIQMQAQIANMKMQQIFDSLVAPRRKEIMKLRMAGDSAALDKLSNQLVEQAKADYAKSPFNFTDEQIKAYSAVGGTPHLDGQYTVFGEVIDGMATIEAIENVATGNADRPKEDIKIISATIVE